MRILERLAPQVPLFFFYVAAGLLLYVVALNAWVSDDAFISMRHAQNLVLGEGLTFNPGERVQGFTNPLWTLVLAFGRLLTDQLMALVFVLSLLLSFLFIFLVRVSRFVSLSAAGGILLALAASKAFVEYSSSGLENGLAHVLLLGVCIVLFTKQDMKREPKRYFLFSFLVALVIFNRFDHALLVLPVWLYETWQRGLARSWKPALLAFSPLIAWCLFATVYYGFLLPNTYYAKLFAGLDAAWYWKRGVIYFQNSFDWDPITLMVIGSSVLAALVLRQRREGLLMLGVSLYLLYVAKVGGDFMSGRFFSASYLLAVVVGARLLQNFLTEKTLKGPAIVFILAPFFITGYVLAPLSPLWRPIIYETRHPIPNQDPAYSIADEALYYCPTSCLSGNTNPDATLRSFVLRGKPEPLPKVAPQDMPVILTGGMGALGFYEPNQRIIDVFALGDPLLARLPYDFDFMPQSLRIGHIGRKVPAGYYATLTTGENRIVDPCVSSLYTDLRTVASGQLFTLDRWRAAQRLHRVDYFTSCRNSAGTIRYEHGWK